MHDYFHPLLFAEGKKVKGMVRNDVLAMMCLGKWVHGFSALRVFVRDTVRAIQIARLLSNTVQLFNAKNRSIISTFLTIKTTRRVGGAVTSNMKFIDSCTMKR